MRKFWIAAVLALLPLTATWAEVQMLDKVIAVVDRNVIMQSQLQERLDQVAMRAASSNMTLPEEDVLREQVLEQLITEELQLQMANRVGFEVSDEQVNQAVEQVRQTNNLSPAQFQQQLEFDGLNIADLRQRFRRDLTIQQIQQAMVQQRIQISQLEIDNFLQSADARFWTSADYHLGHILLTLPQSPTPEQVEETRAEAEALAKRARSDELFADIAIAESDGPAALEGGDLGWRKTSELPSLFAEVVPDLDSGEVSEPFRSGAGFHILKLYEKRGDDQQLQTQTKVRHILLKPSAILSNEEAQAKLEDLRQQILEGADFAELAEEHSEDIGSMLAGGDLGWSRPGMFVPEFERVVQNTEVDEISQPFRSQFGWHILQVTDRREEDVTAEIRRDKAARVLTSRRFEDELQIWLRELRDNAYIDIKS